VGFLFPIYIYIHIYIWKNKSHVPNHQPVNHNLKNHWPGCWLKCCRYVWVEDALAMIFRWSMLEMLFRYTKMVGSPWNMCIHIYICIYFILYIVKNNGMYIIKYNWIHIFI
jgi:hypothetical protein